MRYKPKYGWLYALIVLCLLFSGATAWGLLTKLEQLIANRLAAVAASMAQQAFTTDRATTIRTAIAKAQTVMRQLGAGPITVALSPLDHAALDLSGHRVDVRPAFDMVINEIDGQHAGHGLQQFDAGHEPARAVALLQQHAAGGVLQLQIQAIGARGRRGDRACRFRAMPDDEACDVPFVPVVRHPRQPRVARTAA